MENVNYAGSTWNKWDLHVHSNASDGKGTPQEIIDKALEMGLSVIALTDHHTVKNIDEIKQLGKNVGITVISGIEFRTEYGAKSVHMIGLFPDKHNEIDLDQRALEQLILSPLNLSEVILKAKGKKEEPTASDEKAFKIGMFKVQVDFKKASDLIHQYGGLVSVHAGDKANSLEEMKHVGQAKKNVKDVVDSLGTVKDELLKEYIDICELGSLNDKNASFYIDNYNKPAIVASDAHELSKIGSLYTWIKGDKNFEGLRQIVYEPEQRVKIQISHPEMKGDYQVIESIEVEHIDFGKQVIPLNPNLNTIIGGRSSGKSILLGCIAKLANYSGAIKQGNEDYEKYVSDVARAMKLKWKDGNESALRKVEYFPQSYINKLASDSKETTTLIESILKGDEERKSAFETYNNSISKNLVDISNEIENFFKLYYKKDELIQEIEKIGDFKGIKFEIAKLTKELEEAKNDSNAKISVDEEEQYEEIKREREKLRSLIVKNENIERQLDSLAFIQITKEISSELIGLPEELKMQILDGYELLTSEIKDKWLALIESHKNTVSMQNTTAKDRINEIENCKEYALGEAFYKENAVIEELSKRLAVENLKAEKIGDLNDKIIEVEEEIKKTYCKIISKQENYYDIGERICSLVSLEKDEVKITPFQKFDTEKFIQFIDINLNKRNSQIAGLMEYSFTTKEEFLILLGDLFSKIMEGEVSLKGNREKKQAVLNLMTSNYFELHYEVIYQEDTLSSMSEGKKAFVILRMLLDFNGNECPILIDQPEDDLDNRAIYNDLVTYIRNKKIERQIIIVTHNPNVVVAADSEEIIVANQHGSHNENQDNVKFEYRTGAIENSCKRLEGKPVLLCQGIREHICDILEGGDVAFKKREHKYGMMTRK